jgi:hypothetical protein
MIRTKEELVKYRLQRTMDTLEDANFTEQFIKTNIFEKRYGKMYSQLFTWRQKGEFTRKDYMNVFKDISSATASRDPPYNTKLITSDANGKNYKALNINKIMTSIFTVS